MRILGCLFVACAALTLVSTSGCKKAASTPAASSPGGSQPAGQPAVATTQEKLVGTWIAVKGDNPPGSTMEFTKDGRLKINAKDKDKTGKEVEMKVEGEYKVEGDKTLKVTLKMGDKDVKQTLTIQTLNDTTFITQDEDKKIDEFKRK